MSCVVKRYQSVLGLPAVRRYRHFLRRAVGIEEVWTLKAPTGFVLAGDDEAVRLAADLERELAEYS